MKRKLLPLLLALPLLASCGGVSKLKAPKFADPGKEIKYEKFVENIGKVLDKLDVYNAKKKLPSSVLKYSYQVYGEQLLKRNDKEFTKSVGGEKDELEFKYDASNLLMEETYKYEIASSYVDPLGKSAAAEDYTTHTMYQQAKVKKNNYVVAVDKDNKEYSKEADLDDSYKAVNYHNETLKQIVTDSAVMIESICAYYPYMPKESQKAIKFYQSDKLFTIAIDEDETSDVLDTTSNKVGSLKTTAVMKFQCNLVNDKLSLLSWTETTAEYSIKKTCSVKISGDTVEFAKGDTLSVLSQSRDELSLEYKDVKLKAIDLADYTQLGSAW